MDYLYLPLALLDAIDLEEYAGYTRLCAVLPRVFRTEDEAAFRKALQSHPRLSAVAVSNLGHLPIAAGLGLEIRGDMGLNVFNSLSLLFLGELGVTAATVSPELRHQQVRDLSKYLPCEAVVYGRLPLMITENCPCGAAASAAMARAAPSQTGPAQPFPCSAPTAAAARFKTARPCIWRISPSGKNAASPGPGSASPPRRRRRLWTSCGGIREKIRPRPPSLLAACFTGESSKILIDNCIIII